jgi:hypothetical protein
MAIMDAGMFGLGRPEIAAVLVLAFVIFGWRKFGGGQPPTHPLPGIDPKFRILHQDAGRRRFPYN